MKRKQISWVLSVAGVILLFCLVSCDSQTPSKENVDIVLDAYQNIEDSLISGWCGPSAVAWVYSGLYDDYEGVPLDDSLYDLVNYVKTTYTNPLPWDGEIAQYMLENDIKNAIEDITDGAYTVVNFNSHEWEDAKDWLIDNELPLFSLISLPEGWHWRVVYGVYYSVDEGVYYYKMHDNGFQEGNWLEEQPETKPLIYNLCGLKRVIE